ncbi:MAG: hypothetical protein HYX84_03600 [Chloroflexi bacterium]|nr:hypothetical protein [Chloroflexota bacterium]
MRLSHRRSNIQIIADILRTGENGAGKTKLMYSSNMSYSQTQRYLTFLLNQGFIHRLHPGELKATYCATEAGLRLLRSIENVTEMLGFIED